MLKKGILVGILLISLLLSSCAPGKILGPTLTPTPTDTPTPAPTNTPTPTPTRTPTSTPTLTPTEYPFSTLPGWFGYIDTYCQGMCTNVAISRADFSEPKLLTDHERGMSLKAFWSPDGRYIAFEFFVLGEDGGFQLRLIDLQSNETEILTPRYIDEVSGLSWSPDSRYLVVATESRDGESRKISRIDVQSHQMVDLIGGLSAEEIIPVWSPDGKGIVYSAQNADGLENIWLMDADGANLKNLTPYVNWQSLYPTWSPDGKEIAYYRQTPDENVELWAMDADGGNLHWLYNLGEAYWLEPAVWSPDGSSIAFVYGLKGDPIILIHEIATGTNILRTLDDGQFTNLSWSPDSKALIVTEKEGKSLYLLILINGEEPYTTSASTRMSEVVWSPVAEIPPAE